MAGQGALRRNRKNHEKRKKERRAATQRALEGRHTPTIPTITEADLLAFQTSHFRDDATPDTWFVDAETALGFDPLLEDDGLGYYEDGVKRTLTDEQIEMFRHSEIEQLTRDAKIEGQETTLRAEEELEPVSPASYGSSIEDGLLGLAQAESLAPPRQPVQRQPLQSSFSDTSHASTGQGRRKREEEVPYDQRHKRKWEDYIEENDPTEGSLTHRRIVRELDEQREQRVDLDY